MVVDLTGYADRSQVSRNRWERQPAPACLSRRRRRPRDPANPIALQV